MQLHSHAKRNLSACAVSSRRPSHLRLVQTPARNVVTARSASAAAGSPAHAVQHQQSQNGANGNGAGAAPAGGSVAELNIGEPGLKFPAPGTPCRRGCLPAPSTPSQPRLPLLVHLTYALHVSLPCAGLILVYVLHALPLASHTATACTPHLPPAAAPRRPPSTPLPLLSIIPQLPPPS